jgi:hypothetical protein
MLLVATCVISDVFPTFGPFSSDITLKVKPKTYSQRGTRLSMSYQFAALRMIALKWTWNPFLISRLHIDLRYLCTTRVLYHLQQLECLCAMMACAKPDLVLPRLELFVPITCPEIWTIITRLGVSGVAALHICLTATNPVSADWFTTTFKDEAMSPMLQDLSPTHFGFLTKLCLEGAMILEQRSFPLSILKQNSIMELEVNVMGIRACDLRFILSSISMPQLRILVLQGVLSPVDLEALFERHIDICSLRFGPLSRWLNYNFTTLRSPHKLQAIEGPHTMIAPLFEAHNSMATLRHICLHPSFDHRGLHWDSDDFDRLLLLISHSAAMENLAIYLDHKSLIQLALSFHALATHPLRIKHLFLLEGPHLTPTNLLAVRISAFRMSNSDCTSALYALDQALSPPNCRHGICYIIRPLLSCNAQSHHGCRASPPGYAI